MPNPFSTSNAPQHNLVPKITGGGTGPYNVAVDLVDIDTGYFRQLGASGALIDQIYVNTLNYSTLTGGAITAGPGINIDNVPNGVIISADLLPGYGIDFNINENAIEINSKLDIVAGAGITFRYIDSTSDAHPYGYTEIIATGGGSGSTSGPGFIGEVGGVVYVAQDGSLATNAINLQYDVITDPAEPVLYVPTTTAQTAGYSGIITLKTDAFGDSYIESGFQNVSGSGNYLYIQSVDAELDPNTAAVVTIDTIDSRVGINKDAPDSALDVYGQTVLSYNATSGGGTSVSFIDFTAGPAGSTLLSPGTYRAYAWGAGGAGNSGVGGGGAYGEYDIIVGATGTVYWAGLYGGSNGGGNAMVLSFNADYSSPAFIVPGGGAGSQTTNGIFGGYGGPGGTGYGLPNPEGGYVGSSPRSSASYTDVQPWQYSVIAGTFAIGVTASNDGYPDGVTGNIVGGNTIMSFDTNAFNVQTQTGVGSTFNIFPGTTVRFQTDGISFTGGNFVIPDNLTVSVSSISGLTFNNPGTQGTTGMTGTIVFPNWPGADGITVSDPASVDITGNFPVAGDVLMKSGGGFSYTHPSNATAVFSIFFNGTGTITDTPSTLTYTISPNMRMVTSSPLGTYMIGNDFSVSGTASIPPGSILGVGERDFINNGAVATGSMGALYGGGGLIGGGGPALVTGTGITYSSTNMPAGGGGGSYGGNVAPNRQSPGNKNNAHRTSTYPDGITVGDGGASGMAGGIQYLVLKKKTDTGIIPPALTVNGDERVTGTLYVNTITGTGGAASTALTVNGDETVTGTLYVSTITGTGGAGSTANFTGTLTNAGNAAFCRNGNTSTFTVGIPGQNTTSTVYGPLTLNDAPTSRQIKIGSVNPDVNGLLLSNNGGASGCFIGLNTANNIFLGAGSLGSNVGIQNSLLVGQNATIGSTGFNGYLTVGSVPVATPSPGDIVATNNVSGKDIIASSDRRTKNSIETIDSALDRVLRMRGVFFERNAEPGERRVGVIAQEVEEILPEVVHTDADGMKSVSYGSMIGLLIEAIKELKNI